MNPPDNPESATPLTDELLREMGERATVSEEWSRLREHAKTQESRAIAAEAERDLARASQARAESMRDDARNGLDTAHVHRRRLAVATQNCIEVLGPFTELGTQVMEFPDEGISVVDVIGLTVIRARKAIREAEENLLVVDPTRTELNALKTTLAESQAGWLPIASAPRDGTEVAVWREDAGVFTAHYRGSFQEGDTWGDPTGPECWFSASGEDLTNDMPTHWRALPPPPEDGR